MTRFMVGITDDNKLISVKMVSFSSIKLIELHTNVKC